MRKCPTCNRPFGGTRMFCFACRKPILRGHKFHHEGCYVMHDDCSNPTMRLLVEAPQHAAPETPLLDGQMENPPDETTA